MGILSENQEQTGYHRNAKIKIVEKPATLFLTVLVKIGKLIGTGSSTDDFFSHAHPGNNVESLPFRQIF